MTPPELTQNAPVAKEEEEPFCGVVAETRS